MKTGPLLACGLALCALACRAPFAEPASPVERLQPWGVAAGSTEADAARVAVIAETTLAVFEGLPGFRPGPLRLHLNEFRRPSEYVVGVSVQPESGTAWAAISPSSPQVEHTTAHEMAHFYFRDVLERFPVVVEEGFCDLAAEQVFPDSPMTEGQVMIAAVSYVNEITILTGGDAWRETLAYLLEEAPTIDEALAADGREHLGGGPRQLDLHYGLGLVIARRIGLAGLVALSERARDEGLDTVPVDWIREAAGIEPPSQENLRALFAAAMGGSVDEPLILRLTGGE